MLSQTAIFIQEEVGRYLILDTTYNFSALSLTEAAASAELKPLPNSQEVQLAFQNQDSFRMHQKPLYYKKVNAMYVYISFVFHA